MSPDLRAIAERVLTDAQLEVWKMAARGYGRRRMALILGISDSAARDRLRAAEQKMLAELDRLAEDG